MREEGYYFAKYDGQWFIVFIYTENNIEFAQSMFCSDHDIETNYFDEIGSKIELPN